MDISTILGLIVGTILVGWGIIAGGAGSGLSALSSMRAFWDPPSIAITLGGTFAATLVSYPIERVFALVSITRNAFSSKTMAPAALIKTLVGLAQKARREGLLALEEETEAIGDRFLAKGIQLIVDGTDPELVRNILDTELAFQENRHKSGAAMFDTMAALAPAFGMTGTLIGLIQMLGTLDNPNKIGPGMAVALVTTFYGVVLSNLVFTPLANKLKGRSAQEILLREVMIEGMISIMAGDNPRIVQEKLNAFLAPSSRYQAKRRPALEVGASEARAE